MPADSSGLTPTGLTPTGLTADEVATRTARFGANVLPSDRGLAWWRILRNQVASPLVYVIFVAAAVSLAFGEVGDFAIIAAVLLVNVLLGFVQESRTQRSYLALRGLLQPTATVIRDSRRQVVGVPDLVPGDVVMLKPGDRVPADGEIIDAIHLSVDEAILTGESEPVSKHATAAGADGSAAAEGSATAGAVFMGSSIVSGRALVRVTAIGVGTELGGIAASLHRREVQTPLQARLAAFARLLTWIVLSATVLILVIGLLLGREFLDMLRNAVILAIAAIPEGLTIAVTVILVIGSQRILKRRGLVKRLLAVETLGSVTVICTDKTGTLTEGRMRVTRASFDDEARALQAMILCTDQEGPVEAALWDYAEERLPGGTDDFSDVMRLQEEPFSSESRRMITVVTGGAFGGDRVCFQKGAPEVVLESCDSPSGDRPDVIGHIDSWAGDGQRLLGLAYRVGGDIGDRTGYTWAGLVGMEDPVRDGVAEAVREAGRAGISVKMITGDYPRTAEVIAGRVGIPVGLSLQGSDIDGMTDAQLRDSVASTSLFARIRPQQKLRIVRALGEAGEVTAMIGDGVNDAPALAQADIGVVVGTTTDVAKENADLILLDNDFGTVLAAVEEGRVIFENVRKSLAYILAGAFAEMLVVVAGMVMGWPPPLLIAQILWINLLCDGPSDLVLGFEPEDRGVMREGPRAVREPLLGGLSIALIVVVDLVGAAFALGLFGYFHLVLHDPQVGRSLVMASLALNSMIYIFAYRSLRTPLVRMNPFSNKPLLWAVGAGLFAATLPYWFPALGDLLGVVPLGMAQWALVVGFAVLLLVIVESAKAIAARIGGEGRREATRLRPNSGRRTPR
ncbi:cation-transporting P-type ATPase [soil metagenome]